MPNPSSAHNIEPSQLYAHIINVSNSSPNSHVAIRQICNLMSSFCDCMSTRIGFDGEWYCSDDFYITDYAKHQSVKLANNNDVLFEFYFASPECFHYTSLLRDGSLEVALSLVVGFLSNILLGRLSFEHRERNKELRGINRTTRMLEEHDSIEETLREMCRFLPDAWQYPEATVIRITYGNKVFTSDNFHETPWRQSEPFYLPDNQRGSIEVFYTRDFPQADNGPFLKEERNLLVNIANLIAGSATKHIYNKLSSRNTERLKELGAINRVSGIIAKGLSIHDTLQLVVNTLPHSMLHADAARARIAYQDITVTSPDFAETQWSIRESFVTLDNRKGSIQIYYVERFNDEYDGPFLKEECQLLANLANLVSGYINNYRGRELYNNLPRTASTSVTEDFRKTLTKDKQPLQLFFNKSILEKYIYLDMMKYKVKNILFVATLYDAFILENDDSFFEQFMGEIYQYSLFSLPRITGVTSSSEALELMESTRFDLAILMVGLDTQVTVDLSADIKVRQPDLPVLLLLNQKNNIKYFENLMSYTPSIDKLFVWSGNSEILFSIVKSIEDNANVDNDTKIGLVRVILLVEDSPEYYSKYLQILFGIVFTQVQKLLGEEERNEINKISKMRSRPKILHARNYEDAMYIFEKYKDYLLCVISDVEFERGGTSDPMAGYSMLKYMLSQLPSLPAVLQSADQRNRSAADKLGVTFLDKDSESLQSDLVNFLTTQLGFGDFVFRNHAGRPIAQAKGFKEFETIFRNIPTELLSEYCKDNRISSWLMSRGEIPLARAVNPVKFDDYDDPEQFRANILQKMQAYRDQRRRGKRIDFDDIDRLDEKNIISLATGSLGGKGRGLAFINTLIQNIETSQFDQLIHVRMPITAIIGTDEFTRFMRRADLFPYVAKETDYMQLRRRFAEAELSHGLVERLHRFVAMVNRPIAVRSSSLSEDSMNQPFAGVFDTYIVPNNCPTVEENLQQLQTAIKMVYASIYSDTSRAYFQTIRHNIEEEKMAVVLQVLVGEQHSGYYYPHVSGTAQSYNYYPVAHMKPDEGFAVAGFGLGYYVVGGSKAFRFSPVWPNIDIMSTADIVKNTQVEFLAVDLGRTDIDYIAHGEQAPLSTLDIMDAEKHGTLRHCASVYNPQNDTIEPGLSAYGPRVVNFADILKYDYIPLARLLSLLLNTAKDALGSPVEIEWAVDLTEDEQGIPSFYLLQMKPIITQLQGSSVVIDNPRRESTLLYTEQSLGNGDLKNIRDIIFVDPDTFDKLDTQTMAKEIEYLNNRMIEDERPYVLIGPGRWGTRDRFIGIPVAWSQISMAKVIVEMSLPGFPLDSSLGSHFFHNVTSMNIGYLSVQDSSTTDYINWELLRTFPVIERTKYFCHVQSVNELSVKMNGKERRALIAQILDEIDEAAEGETW